MWTEFCCRRCFDRVNLHERWVSLTPSAVAKFGLHDVFAKTVTVAQRKNLPASLESFGTEPFRLDYRLPEHANANASANANANVNVNGVNQRHGHNDRAEANEDADADEMTRMTARIGAVDPNEVPMSVFSIGNSWRVADHVGAITHVTPSLFVPLFRSLPYQGRCHLTQIHHL
jgi:hypothetical protein